MRKLRSLPLLLLVGLTACAFNTHNPVNGASESDLASERQRLRDLIVDSSKHQGRGFAELRDAISARAFVSLTIDDQFEALTLAAAAAGPAEERLAQSYLDRAIALPGIGFEDLSATLRMAANGDYEAGAIKSLTLLAQRWPERMASVEKLLIRRTLFFAAHVPKAARLAVLQALYAAHWKLEWDMEPSESWRDLTLLLMERGSEREAIAVSTHITDPYILVAMRADRRFDGAVASHPEQFDVEAAAVKERKRYQALAEQNPKSLMLRRRLLEALLHEQHYAAMLAESDAVVQAIRSTNYPEKLYDDYVEQHSQYLFLRSIALQREGRREEALAQALDASHEGDINQLINLATLYWAMDRPKEALSVVATIGPARVSSYGAMQLETVKLQAAVRLGDRDQAARSADYLSEHRADSPSNYSVSLIITKQWARAAQYMITELRDPDLRQDVLRDMQDYQPTPGSELETELDRQWHTVVARKEVQAAIHKVGRIESYRLEAP
jgi:hypothetical protein